MTDISTSRRVVVFGATFLTAWWVLDRLVTTPPHPGSAAAALAAAALVLALGQRLGGTPWAQVPAALGLGRPAGPAVALAGLVGSIYIAVLLLGAQGLGVTLEVRQNWPAVLVAVLLFHGLAEELVWRGFVFARLRERRPFAAAVWWSVPLIALTHVPIIITDGWLVGGLATLTAAVTCWPLAHLWERGNRTVWAPALLHGVIGTWQLFERSYPASFSLVVLGASLTVPLLVFLHGRAPTTMRSPTLAAVSSTRRAR
jgi:membrane protease YdiL (CAAX protease family)